MYGPKDIETVTGGYVDSSRLRSWVRRDLFNTPLAAPPPGKPRQFPLPAVYEAAVLAELNRMGVPIPIAKRWNAFLVGVLGTDRQPEVWFWRMDDPANVDFSPYACSGNYRINTLCETLDREACTGDPTGSPVCGRSAAVSILHVGHLLGRVDRMLAGTSCQS